MTNVVTWALIGFLASMEGTGQLANTTNRYFTENDCNVALQDLLKSPREGRLGISYGCVPMLGDQMLQINR